MQDFNQFSNDFDNLNVSDNIDQGLLGMVNSIAKKFDGKNQNDLLKAIYLEAEKGKRNGTLTNEQLDAFANMLAPALDDKKRKLLAKVVAELKKI